MEFDPTPVDTATPVIRFVHLSEGLCYSVCILSMWFSWKLAHGPAILSFWTIFIYKARYFWRISLIVFPSSITEFTRKWLDIAQLRGRKSSVLVVTVRGTYSSNTIARSRCQSLWSASPNLQADIQISYYVFLYWFRRVAQQFVFKILKWVLKLICICKTNCGFYQDCNHGFLRIHCVDWPGLRKLCSLLASGAVFSPPPDGYSLFVERWNFFFAFFFISSEHTVQMWTGNCFHHFKSPAVYWQHYLFQDFHVSASSRSNL